jgi:hypothetical protein
MTLHETDSTDGLWYEEEMTLTLKFERSWADDKTLKFTDIYQEDFCGAGPKVRATWSTLRE